MTPKQGYAAEKIRRPAGMQALAIPDVPKAWRGFPVPEQSPWVGYTTPLYGPY